MRSCPQWRIILSEWWLLGWRYGYTMHFSEERVVGIDDGRHPISFSHWIITSMSRHRTAVLYFISFISNWIFCCRHRLSNYRIAAEASPILQRLPIRRTAAVGRWILHEYWTPPTGQINVRSHCLHCIYRVRQKKVNPCRIFQIFKQPLRIFWRNSAIIFSVHTDT